ncbi:hypothetical protein P3T36_003326 [Kitasatospora sp. MAP12-15]|uniref:DUF317 domain-containing protein n=1 Tax=unclassified Kitasatospora TaxID=2633591 RepID=UPI0024753B82|nr:DUF317 domain-containing protein [Kitasatospora sp. MAP12-44]MDH6111302.1 hypothetical protein [Kitasatospora sp. MAP12-44]
MPYTDDDLRAAAAEHCAAALEHVDLPEHVVEHLEDQVIPSSKGYNPRTWGSLPEAQRDLAYELATDLVLDAAWRAEQLVGHIPAPDAPRVASPTTTPILTPLAELPFTSDDILTAAVRVAAKQIAWASDDASDIWATMDGQFIQSTLGNPVTARKWSTLPQDQREPVEVRVYELLYEARDLVGTLFAPEPRPAPIANVAPPFLAGPGHNPMLPGQPLQLAAWIRAEREGATRYTSPCGRVRAEARTTDTSTGTDTTWTTSCHALLTGREIWHAQFDPQTPPEIVAALHTAIATQLATAPRALFDPSTPPDAGLAPLRTAGWFAETVPGYIAWTEPSAEIATIGRCTDPGSLAAGKSDDWVLSGGVLGPGPKEGWYAQLSARIPAELLAAVTGAVADRTPVERLGRDLTDEHLIYLDVQPLNTVGKTQAPAPTRAGAAALRTAVTQPSAAQPLHHADSGRPEPARRGR